MFQANTNSSLKNLETQVEQLTLAVQNQFRNSFPSDTKKNPKDSITVTLRSGKELYSRNEAKIKQTKAEKEKTYQNSTISEKNLNRNGLSDTNEKMKEQSEVAKDEEVHKEEVRVYQPLAPFPQILQ